MLNGDLIENPYRGLMETKVCIPSIAPVLELGSTYLNKREILNWINLIPQMTCQSCFVLNRCVPTSRQITITKVFCSMRAALQVLSINPNGVVLLPARSYPPPPFLPIHVSRFLVVATTIGTIFSVEWTVGCSLDSDQSSYWLLPLKWTPALLQAVSLNSARTDVPTIFVFHNLNKQFECNLDHVSMQQKGGFVY